MKDSTKKTLLLLSNSEDRAKPYLVVSDLPLLLPELSSPGIRSLVHWWQAHQLLVQTLQGGEKVLVATEYGQLMLNRSLPGMGLETPVGTDQNQTKAAGGCLLVLRQPPAKDPGFRALRALLKSHQALLIGRGNYVLSSPMAAKLRPFLLMSYPTNVWLVEVADWLVGNYRDLLLAQPSLMDGLEAFSGISKEINQLLMKYSTEKGLTDSSKIRWYSLYHRFYLIFCENTGIIAQFLGPDQQPTALLSQFQRVLANAT